MLKLLIIIKKIKRRLLIMNENLIPLPKMSEYLLEDFMLPMNLDVDDVSKGANIPVSEMQAILNNEIEITPDLSEKLAAFFGVSKMLFYKIQCEINSRELAMPEAIFA